MKLRNILITVTIQVPEMEIQKDWPLDVARRYIREQARQHIFQEKQSTVVITDCPDYPAICQ